MILNMTARNTALGLFVGTYATAQLRIMNGGSVLVTHTMAGFGTPSSAVVTANAVANATVALAGTANTARLVAGSNELTLSVGLSGSGAQVIMSSLELFAGGNSIVNSVTMDMPSGA